MRVLLLPYVQHQLDAYKVSLLYSQTDLPHWSHVTSSQWNVNAYHYAIFFGAQKQCDQMVRIFFQFLAIY